MHLGKYTTSVWVQSLTKLSAQQHLAFFSVERCLLPELGACAALVEDVLVQDSG